MPLIKVVIKPLVKSVLIPLGLTTAAWVADVGIYKKILESGTSTLIISNDVMEDIVKTVKYLEDSGLLSKEVNEKVHNEAEEQKGGFLSMLLGRLGVSLLANISAGTGINKSDYGNKKGKGIITASYGSKLDF